MPSLLQYLSFVAKKAIDGLGTKVTLTLVMALVDHIACCIRHWHTRTLQVPHRAPCLHNSVRGLRICHFTTPSRRSNQHHLLHIEL